MTRKLDLLQLMRRNAPVFDREAARVVCDLVPQLLEIESTILCFTHDEASSYCDLSSQCLGAMSKLGLESVDIRVKGPLSEFIATRLLEAVMVRMSDVKTSGPFAGAFSGRQLGGPFFRHAT